jgi:Zn-dependent protease
VLVALLAVAFAPRAESLVPGLGARAWIAGAGVGVLVYLAALLHESAHAVVARSHGRLVPTIRLTAAGGRTHVLGEAAGPGEEGGIAVVGPAVSIVLGVAALALRRVVDEGVAALVLEALVLANLLIGLLDLLPAPPLDGGRMVRAVAWQVTGSRARGAIVAAWVGRGVAVVLLAVPLVVLPAAGTRPGLSLWAVCVGMALLVWTASTSELGFYRLRLRVEGVPLTGLVRPVEGDEPAEAPRVRWEATADEVLVTLVRRPGTDHVVVDGDGVVRGVVSLADVDRVVRQR